MEQQLISHAHQMPYKSNSSGPPYYVDLIVGDGQTVSLPFNDGKTHLITGPANVTMVSNNIHPPIKINKIHDKLIKQVVDKNGTLRQVRVTDSRLNNRTSNLTKRSNQNKIVPIDNNNNLNNMTNLKTISKNRNLFYAKNLSNSILEDHQKLGQQVQPATSAIVVQIPEQQHQFACCPCICYDCTMLTNNNQINSVPSATHNAHLYNSSFNVIDNQLPAHQTIAQTSVLSAKSTAAHLATQFSCKNNISINQAARQFSQDNLMSSIQNCNFKTSKTNLLLPNMNSLFQATLVAQTHSNYINANATSNNTICPQQTSKSTSVSLSKSSYSLDANCNNMKSVVNSTTFNGKEEKQFKSLTDNFDLNEENANSKKNSNSIVRNELLPNASNRISNFKIKNNVLYSQIPFNYQNFDRCNELNDKMRKERLSSIETNCKSNIRLRKKDVLKLDLKTNARYDETKLNKSVDSPITSCSPISDHYDLSSEDSENNLPACRTLHNASYNQVKLKISDKRLPLHSKRLEPFKKSNTKGKTYQFKQHNTLNYSSSQLIANTSINNTNTITTITTNTSIITTTTSTSTTSTTNTNNISTSITSTTSTSIITTSSSTFNTSAASNNDNMNNVDNTCTNKNSTNLQKVSTLVDNFANNQIMIINNVKSFNNNDNNKITANNDFKISNKKNNNNNININNNNNSNDNSYNENNLINNDNYKQRNSISQDHDCVLNSKINFNEYKNKESHYTLIDNNNSKSSKETTVNQINRSHKQIHQQHEVNKTLKSSNLLKKTASEGDQNNDYVGDELECKKFCDKCKTNEETLDSLYEINLCAYEENINEIQTQVAKTDNSLTKNCLYKLNKVKTKCSSNRDVPTKEKDLLSLVATDKLIKTNTSSTDKLSISSKTRQEKSKAFHHDADLEQQTQANLKNKSLNNEINNSDKNTKSSKDIQVSNKESIKNDHKSESLNDDKLGLKIVAEESKKMVEISSTAGRDEQTEKYEVLQTNYDGCKIEESIDAICKQKMKFIQEDLIGEQKLNYIKQNKMPTVIAFNLIELSRTCNSVRLKWTKNNNLFWNNLNKAIYQVEMSYCKKEMENQTKYSRIVHQSSFKTCKVNNLEPLNEYTFRIRLVYENQLYLSNDLIVILPKDKRNSNAKKKLIKTNQSHLNSFNKASLSNMKISERKFWDSDLSQSNPLSENKLIKQNLQNLYQRLTLIKCKVECMVKEKIYAFIYLCIFAAFCYLIAINFYHYFFFNPQF